MKWTLIISILTFQYANALTLNDAKQAIGGVSAGNIICNDNSNTIPANSGFNLAKKEAYIYFNEAVASEQAEVKKILEEAKQHELAPIFVKGSASLIPWGQSSCTNNKAIYSDFDKLKACNEPLAKQRAENVATIAKQLFGGINQIKDQSKITSEVGYNPNCKSFDETKRESYHKYQYVYIKFDRARCSEAEIYTSVNQIAMNGGQCNGICTDAKSGKMADGTQCSRYLRLNKTTTIEFDAQQVPDKFTMIKVNACKKGDVDTTGYISTLSNYINNPSLLDKYRYSEVKSVDQSLTLYRLMCKRDIAKTGKALSCEYTSLGAGYYQCVAYNEIGKAEGQCNSDDFDRINFNVAINPAAKIDHGNKEVLPIANSAITFKFASLHSGNKIIVKNDNKIIADILSERNSHAQKEKFISSQLKKQINDEIGVPHENGKGSSKLKHVLSGIEKAKNRGIKVSKGPVPKTFAPGDYCLQVEAPDTGTVWTAK